MLDIERNISIISGRMIVLESVEVGGFITKKSLTAIASSPAKKRS